MRALVKSGSADVRISECCIRIRAEVSVRVRISNMVRGRVKLINYSLITTLPIATSAHPLFTHGLLMTHHVLVSNSLPELSCVGVSGSSPSSIITHLRQCNIV